MLRRPYRLTDSGEYRRVARQGRRARSGGLIVYLSTSRRADSPRSAQVGFIVGKSVGNSVVRHTVTRRLRSLLAQRHGQLGHGEVLLVRALPEAAAESSQLLARDLDRSLQRLGRAGP